MEAFIRPGSSADLTKRLETYLRSSGGVELHSLRTLEADLQLELDQASATVLYIGKAAPGTAANAAGWQIKKFTENGALSSLKFADGSSAFSFVWADRASYTY